MSNQTTQEILTNLLGHEIFPKMTFQIQRAMQATGHVAILGTQYGVTDMVRSMQRNRAKRGAYLLRRLTVGVVILEKRERLPRRRPHVRRRHGEGRRRGQQRQGGDDEERRHGPRGRGHQALFCSLNLKPGEYARRNENGDENAAGFAIIYRRLASAGQLLVDTSVSQI